MPAGIQEKIQSIEVSVLQRPYAVRIECPYCQAENDVSYGEFTGKYGDPPDWNGSEITCPDCGRKILIDSQSWD